MKICILNILRLIIANLDATIIVVTDQHFITTIPCNYIANRAYDPIVSNDIEDV